MWKVYDTQLVKKADLGKLNQKVGIYQFLT